MKQIIKPNSIEIKCETEEEYKRIKTLIRYIQETNIELIGYDVVYDDPNLRIEIFRRALLVPVKSEIEKIIPQIRKSGLYIIDNSIDDFKLEKETRKVFISNIEKLRIRRRKDILKKIEKIMKEEYRINH